MTLTIPRWNGIFGQFLKIMANTSQYKRDAMGAKILVVDDSNTIQTAVQLTFSREEMELIPARSGEEAIRKAKEVAPDLMLIDTDLPDASGYEICRTLKADPVMRDVPVIMLTGAFEAPDGPMVQTVGANDFIAKPFESQSLIAKVKQLLDSRPMRLPTPAGIEFEPALRGKHLAAHILRRQGRPCWRQSHPLLISFPPLPSHPRSQVRRARLRFRASHLRLRFPNPLQCQPNSRNDCSSKRSRRLRSRLSHR